MDVRIGWHRHCGVSVGIGLWLAAGGGPPAGAQAPSPGPDFSVVEIGFAKCETADPTVKVSGFATAGVSVPVRLEVHFSDGMPKIFTTTVRVRAASTGSPNMIATFADVPLKAPSYPVATLRAVVDPEMKLPESNENNNTKTIAASAIPLACRTR
jgi:hypothetical protein